MPLRGRALPLKARPVVVYACHCKDCQRFSGTTHTLSMFVKADDVELITGELKGYDKAADSGRTVRMLGCTECGTKVWNEPLSFPGAFGEVMIRYSTSRR